MHNLSCSNTLEHLSLECPAAHTLALTIRDQPPLALNPRSSTGGFSNFNSPQPHSGLSWRGCLEFAHHPPPTPRLRFFPPSIPERPRRALRSSSKCTIAAKRVPVYSRSAIEEAAPLEPALNEVARHFSWVCLTSDLVGGTVPQVHIMASDSCRYTWYLELRLANTKTTRK